MKEIYFRKAELNDLPVLYDFEQGIVEAERPFDKTLKSGHINYYDLESMIGSIETEVIVALYEDEIVGSAYVRIRKAKSYEQHSKYAYLGFMFVKPEFRGNGISQKIIAEIKKLVNSKNITELRLDVYSENQSAIRAYEKSGFNMHLTTMRLGL